MQKNWIVLFVIAGLFIPAILAMAAQPGGTKNIVLFGGNTGNIDFPHHRHQAALSDCNRCHQLFPQEENAIQRLQAQGKLKKKQVMDQCRGCHKEMKRSGAATGPTNCRGCHKK